VRRLACLVALLVAGCGADEERPAAAPALADLTVRVDRDGDGGKPARTAQVRCAAPGDSPACRAVAALKASELEPPAGGVACSQLYGGPETARITGTLRGKRVDASFSRENGCQIARWEAAAPVLRAAG
jgi:hypothetical protein